LKNALAYYSAVVVNAKVVGLAPLSILTSVFSVLQKLKVEIERQTKKLEKKKEAHGDATLDRTQKRKMDREEERLKSTNRDLVRAQHLFKSNFKQMCLSLVWAILTTLDRQMDGRTDGQMTSPYPYTGG
jgi:uncharacterized membrane protein (DUF106 family)